MRSATARGLCLALTLFAFANGLAVNGLLPHLPGGGQKITTLDYTGTLFRGVAHQDSWMPMRRALKLLYEPSEPPLYETLFFEQKTKFQYPPTSLLLLEPLARVRGGVSDRVLNAISRAMLALLCAAMAALLWRAAAQMTGAPPATWLRVALAMLAIFSTLTFYPVVRGLYLGQIQTWIDALIALTLWAWLGGRARVAGVLTALACAIKPTLGGLLLWALLRREWRYAQGFVAAAMGLGLASLLLYGFWNHVGYLEVLSFMSQHGESFHANQSLNGLLHRALGNGPNLVFEPEAFAPYHPLVYLLTVLSTLGLMAGALWWRVRGTPEAKREAAPSAARDGQRDMKAETYRAQTREIDFGVAIATFTLASPIVWEHHYGVLLPLFALALPAAWRFDVQRNAAGRTRFALVLLGLAYALVSNNLRVANRLAETPLNFLQSYVLFGGLMLLALLHLLRAGTVPRGEAEHA